MQQNNSAKNAGWSAVLSFWFETCTPDQWFEKDGAFDKKIQQLFSATYGEVVRGETAHWREVPQGRLAEVIVLDQFARNMFRGTPQAFQYDPLALALAQEGVRHGDDQKLVLAQREFLYMPFMHSESRKIHEQALALFRTTGGRQLDSEIKHKAIIDRFGRFPHRNRILGRISTPDEEEFLKTNPGF